MSKIRSLVINSKLNRRDFLEAIGGSLAGTILPGCIQRTSSEKINIAAQTGKCKNLDYRPNFIVIFCDNLGYGGIGCFGSKKNRTPNTDRMADEGMRFTSCYVTSGVCTPSRASLMTGCYPRRINMHQSATGFCVLRPAAKRGLNPEEITIAEVLKERNYATALIGKWHLGDQPEFMPTRQGFDYYFGIPYSDDMGSHHPGMPPLPLMRNEKVIDAPVDLRTVTKRYTCEALEFITKNKDKPFFICLAHATPGSTNNPQVSDQFRGKSNNGSYGDSVEEIDWSTGKILATLKELGIDNRTMVIFTTDHGAVEDFGGSNAPLSGWGYSTTEGGMRIPCVMRWPGEIPTAKTCDELVTTMDLLPTFAKLAGTKPPQDRIIDGKNIWPLMCGREGIKSPHQVFYYYLVDQLQAVRSGKWKMYLPLDNWRLHVHKKDTKKSSLKLYDLQVDIGETTDVSSSHPDVVKRLLALAEKARDDLGDNNRKGKNQRQAGFVVNPKPQLLKPKCR